MSSDGLCHQCAERKQATLEKQKQEEIDYAIRFIRKMNQYVQKAFARTTVFPAMGKEPLIEQKKYCDYVVENIDNWKNYPYIKEALFATGIPEKYGRITIPLFNTSFFQDGTFEIDKEFEKLKKKATRLSSDCLSASFRAFDYSELYRVVGVSFKNGRRSRQTILRQIRFHDAPYSKRPEITLKRYLFENEDAVAVYANDEQIGNISKSDLPFLIEHWDEYTRIDDFDITGSTDTSFGIVIKAVFSKSTLG